MTLFICIVLYNGKIPEIHILSHRSCERNNTVVVVIGRGLKKSRTS